MATACLGSTDLEARFPEPRAPFVAVLLTECAQLNRLLVRMQTDLAVLAGALRGNVPSHGPVRHTMDSFLAQRVPPAWAALSYPSVRPLLPWVTDLSGTRAPVCAAERRLTR